MKSKFWLQILLMLVFVLLATIVKAQQILPKPHPTFEEKSGY